MTQRYRAENERSTWMRFHTQTAGVSLTAQQPLNNLTRVAIQALAAVLGGSQSLHTDAYDEAWAVPSAEAALLALRQQQVIASETGVTNTVDPLGGSWFVESLTNEVERQVWRYLDEIDRLRRHGRGDRSRLPAEGDRRRGVPLPARVRPGRARDRRRQRLRRSGRGAGHPAARGERGVAAAPPGAARTDACASAIRSASPPLSRGCATFVAAGLAQRRT